MNPGLPLHLPLCRASLIAALLLQAACGGTPTPPSPPVTTPAPTPAPTPTSGAPIVEATVSTISLGALPAGIGTQGIALGGDRTLLYVSESARNVSTTGGCHSSVPPQPNPPGVVAILDASTGGRVADIPLPTGFPVHAELDAATGRVYVAASERSLYALEGTSRVASSTEIGGLPHDIGIDSSIGLGIVTNTVNFSQTFVSVVSLPSLQVLATINTGGFGPHKAAVDPSTHLAYVTHAEFAKVDVVDLQRGQLIRQIDTGLDSGGAFNAIDPSRRVLYTIGASGTGINSSRLLVIDLTTERPGAQLALPVGAHGTRVDSLTGRVWVILEEQGQVSVVDPATLTERARIPVGRCPYYLDIDAVRRLAYVTNQADNTVSVIDMTKVPFGTAATAAAAMRILRTGTATAGARTMRGVTDQVIDAVSPLRIPPAHSVRERIARAEDDFRRYWRQPISEEMAVDALNVLAEQLVAPSWARTTVDQLRAFRGMVAPRLSPSATALIVPPLTDASGSADLSGEMSPLEAALITLALGGSKLSDPEYQVAPERWLIERRGGGLDQRRVSQMPFTWTSYRRAFEQALSDETSAPSRSAHGWLTRLGIPR